MKILKRIRLKKPARYHWLITVCLIVAGYMIIDGFTFMLNPYSGRISTFACKTTSPTGTLCTVTIYGLREVYRRSFTPAEFFRAVVLWNYPGDSYDITYGLTILTIDGEVSYIPRIHPPGRLEQKARQINDLFVEGEPVSDTLIVNLALDLSQFRRLFIILLALGLAWYVSRVDMSWFWFDQPVRVERRSFWPIVQSWAGVDVLIRIGFYLAVAGVMGCGAGSHMNSIFDFTSGCFGVFLSEPQLSQFPWGHLLCVYPLVFLLVMQALWQRKLLARLNIKVSTWWVAAPFLATLVIPILSPGLTWNDCVTFKYLMAGYADIVSSPASAALIVYFLLVGLVQWAVFRKQLPRAIIWVIMPLINAMLVLLPWLAFDTYEVSPGNVILLILLALILSVMIPALTMSWLVNRKAPLPDAEA